MRQTRNEIYRLCQKAARAAGAPAGMEVEAARATTWLCARGLPALHMLAGELSRWWNKLDCSFSYDPPHHPLDAGGKSGALVAPLLVDMTLLSAIENTAPLEVANLSLPLYLVPTAHTYSANGWYFDFHLRAAGGDMFHINIAPRSGISVRTSTQSKLAALFEQSFDITAQCRSSIDSPPVIADDNGDLLLLDDEALVRAAGHNLANGIEVDAGTWDQLAAYAAKALVPTSEKSRSGAGAVTSDNE